MGEDRHLQPLTILCPTCRQPATRVESIDQSAEGPRMDFYQCETCVAGSKLAVIFELSGEHARPAPGFVEREIARRGAFFPSDYTGSGPRRW